MSHAVIKAAGRELSCPNQMFINGVFTSGSATERYTTINPATEEVSSHNF